MIKNFLTFNHNKVISKKISNFYIESVKKNLKYSKKLILLDNYYKYLQNTSQDSEAFSKKFLTMSNDDFYTDAKKWIEKTISDIIEKNMEEQSIYVNIFSMFLFLFSC